jgi:hypothetical protein
LAVNVKDGFFGEIIAVCGFIFAFDNGEGVHDVSGIIDRNAVEVKIGGIQFAAQEGTSTSLQTGPLFCIFCFNLRIRAKFALLHAPAQFYTNDQNKNGNSKQFGAFVLNF